MDTILVERDGAIATVVLNRPEKLNALTRAMWGALGEAVDALSADDSVRCVVVRGAGHQLPYSRPADCIDAIRDVLAR